MNKTVENTEDDVALDKAWKVLEKGWCQGELAKTEDGEGCPYFYSKACSHCTLGALYLVYFQTSDSDFDTSDLDLVTAKLLNHIEPLGFDSIVKWNDHPSQTQEDVIKVLKELDI